MKAKCLWFTGLPCSGKTTIVNRLKRNYRDVQVLDGDQMRNTPLANFVGFSPEDRKQHLLRMAHLAKMFVDQGITVLCSFVSPSEEVRKELKTFFTKDQFAEIYVNATLETCIGRDVKGMYKKALNGEINNFTGIQANYDKPQNPDLELNTDDQTLEQCIEKVLKAFPPREEKKCLFIGRWNGVFHNGHDHIIQSKIKEGKNILLAIRDVKPDQKNPWTASEVKEMLDYRFKDYPQVDITIIPDIESVEYGRGVGYEVNQIQVTENIAGISGTKCREMIKNGNDQWKQFVPKEIVEFLESKQ